MQSILEKDNSVIKSALDFFDLAGGQSKRNTESTKDKEYLGGSVAKYVKDLVMTFPTMFDTSLSPSTAGMVSRANERNIVTMLQLLFGSMQLSAKSGREAIQKVHTNLKGSMGLEDIMNLIQDELVSKESANVINGIRISDVVREMTDYLKYKTQKSYPVSSLRETSLSDYLVIKDYYGNDVVREAAKAGSTETKKEKEERLQREVNKDTRDNENHSREMLPTVLTNQDIKKANELTPTLMVITFNEVLDNGETGAKTSFVAGVKSRLIPVDSKDIIDRVAAKKNTAMNFLNFIRATTGEISFTKDFLFAVKQSKLLAKNSAKRGAVAQMWNALDSRHVSNNKNAIQGSGNDASAITTLVINQETVNMIKKEYNYNIEDPKIARYIMNEYNLLGLIICDESIEVAKILYHGNDGFEQNPYSFLNRENDNAKAYKDVINLVNQTRR